MAVRVVPDGAAADWLAGVALLPPAADAPAGAAVLLVGAAAAARAARGRKATGVVAVRPAPVTNSCVPCDGSRSAALVPLMSAVVVLFANSRYGPFGRTFVVLGSATVTVPAPVSRPTTGSDTVRASPSTRWVSAVLRIRTTEAIFAASLVCTTRARPAACRPLTEGRPGLPTYGGCQTWKDASWWLFVPASTGCWPGTPTSVPSMVCA